MNKVFKTKDDRSPQSLEDRLKSYAKEKIQQPMHDLLTGKGTLAILTPLAAASLVSSDINAQCGAGSFDNVQVSTGDGYIYSIPALDVDGDGNPDFIFSTGFDNYITPIGTISIGVPNSYYVSALPYGAPINGTGAYGANYYFFPSTVVNTMTTVYVPIKNAACELGFIEITFDATGGFSINVAQSGISTSGDPVLAGVCSTLDSALPITLSNFNVRKKQSEIMLSWSTESELDNEGFEIQRSADGKNFYKIGWIDGAGTNNSRLDYGYTDKDVRSNVLYYYRLKQTDLNGKFTYSSVLNAKIKGDHSLEVGTVYPNPVKASEINLEVISNGNHELTYELLNPVGQKVAGRVQMLSEGLNNISIPTSNLTNGTYFLKIDTVDFSEYKKIVIEK